MIKYYKNDAGVQGYYCLVSKNLLISLEASAPLSSGFGFNFRIYTNPVAIKRRKRTLISEEEFQKGFNDLLSYYLGSANDFWKMKLEKLVDRYPQLSNAKIEE